MEPTQPADYVSPADTRQGGASAEAESKGASFNADGEDSKGGFTLGADGEESKGGFKLGMDGKDHAEASKRATFGVDG